DRLNEAGGPALDVPSKPASAETSRVEVFAESFATAVAPRLYNRGLTKQSVTILALPGVTEVVLKGLTDQIVAAGGTVADRVRITTGLTAPGEKAMVDTLATELAQQLPGTAD